MQRTEGKGIMKKRLVICDICKADEAEILRDLSTAVGWSVVQVLVVGEGGGTAVKDVCWKCMKPILKSLQVPIAKKPTRAAE